MEQETYSGCFVVFCIVVFLALGFMLGYDIAECDEICPPIGCEEYNEDGHFLACYNYGMENIKVIPISGSISPQTVTGFKAIQGEQWYHVEFIDGAVVKRQIEKPY